MLRATRTLRIVVIAGALALAAAWPAPAGGPAGGSATAAEKETLDYALAPADGVTLRSQPFASQLRAGERLVVAVGGGSVELTPDPLHPALTLHAATFRLPVVDGALTLSRQQ